MKAYDFYHISFFDSILKGLKTNGVNLEKLCRGSYIRRFDLQNPDTYFPVEVAYTFFDSIKNSQHVDCLATEFYGGFNIKELSEYGEYLSICPDLLTLLENGIKYDHLVQSSGRLRLVTDGILSRYSMQHMDGPSEGRLVSEKINVAMFANTFRMFLGSNWTPLKVEVTTSDANWLEDLFPSLNFNIITNSQEISFTFLTSELATKNKNYRESGTELREDNSTMESTANKVFNSMLSNSDLPTIEEFSSYFGISRRTVIRHFRREGKSYRFYIENHLMKESLRLISDSSLSILEISEKLGFSHPSNFIRAFKKWTNSTPNRYRRQLSNL